MSKKIGKLAGEFFFWWVWKTAPLKWQKKVFWNDKILLLRLKKRGCSLRGLSRRRFTEAKLATTHTFQEQMTPMAGEAIKMAMGKGTAQRANMICPPHPDSKDMWHFAFLEDGGMGEIA